MHFVCSTDYPNVHYLSKLVSLINIVDTLNCQVGLHLGPDSNHLLVANWSLSFGKIFVYNLKAKSSGVWNQL